MMAEVASENDAGGGQHVRLRYVDRCTFVAAAMISSKSSQVSRPTLPMMLAKKGNIFEIRRFPSIPSLPSICRRSIGEIPRIVMYSS